MAPRLDVTGALILFLYHHLPRAYSHLQICMGLYETCSLMSNEYKCWGDWTGNTVPPSNAFTFEHDFVPIRIISGEYHHCIISNQSTARCWGDNGYGQLGYGHTDDIAYGTTLDDIDFGTAFYVEDGGAGQYHSCFLSNQSQIKCIGRNNYGQLGYGDTEDRGDNDGDMGDDLPFVDLGDGFIPIQLVVGADHNCVLSSNSDIKCWGRGDMGSLGYENTEHKGNDFDEMGNNLNTVDLGDFTPVSLGAGGWHNCAMSDLYSLKCWGNNHHGSLGLEDTNNRGDEINEMGDHLPTVNLGSNFFLKDLMCGVNQNCVLSTSGSIKCFGYGAYGRLGYGNTDSIGNAANEMGDNLVAVDLGSDFNASRFGEGPIARHSCAISIDNHLKCWGYNQEYQLGLGDNDNRGNDANEMGDELPYVVIPTPAPTLSPTLAPTSSPSHAPGLSTSGPSGYAHISPGCVDANNIIKYSNKSVSECMDLCDADINCLAFEYGVDYGGPGSYEPRDCQLQSSANYNGCDGSVHNLDLYIKNTADPTKDPSEDPTVAPSAEPTDGPTDQPTMVPTTFPSPSPTLCIDYNDDYNSNDGVDQINGEFVVSIPSSFNYSDPNQAIIVYNSSTILVNTILGCDWKDGDICFIECASRSSCFHSIVIPSDGVVLDQLVITCADTESCNEIEVNLTTSEVETVYIFCLEADSCESMTIDVSASNTSTLTVHCNATRSCKDVIVNLNGDQSGHSLTAEMLCYDDNSCDGLTITTSGYTKNIELTLNMTRWSDSVSIHHFYTNNVNVHCGSGDEHLYIQYEIDALLDDEKLLDITRKEYSSNRLPCEDITIHCSNNSDFDHHCTYEYDLHIDFESILNDSNSADCYWLDLGEVYLADCQGACGDVMVYNEYPISFDLNLIFEGQNVHNDSNETVSYLICDEYFGTKNDTASSLQSIDILFKYVLDLIAKHSGVIHSLSFGPKTSLRDDAGVYCQNMDINVIAITTYLRIKSADTDGTAIEDIFAENGEFMNSSADLLSEFFDVPVTLALTLEEILEDIGYSLLEIVAASIVAVLIVLIIGWITYRIRRVIKRILIQNPMVITIAIAEYDDRETVANPQIDGELDPLPPLRKDVMSIMNVFGKELGYDIYPEYPDLNESNPIKLHWTKEEIVDLFERKSAHLSRNLNVYDGLVVVISCHGMQGDIISSDYQRIPKRFIHRLFTMAADKVAVRDIPRLFVFDCCDGTFDRDKFIRDIKALNADGNESKLMIENVGGSTNRVTTEWKGDTPWKRGEHNPDHRMAVIHAANEDFQSICRERIGSDLIYFFTKALRLSMSSWNICRGPRYLGEMMNEIQHPLENKPNKGGQLVVPVYTNETERIVFGKRRTPSETDRGDRASSNVEMKQQDDKHAMIEVPVQQTIVEEEEVTMDDVIDVTDAVSIATNPIAAESHDVEQNETNKMSQGIAGKVLKYEVLGLLEQESVVNDPEYQQMNIDYVKRRKKKM